MRERASTLADYAVLPDRLRAPLAVAPREGDPTRPCRLQARHYLWLVAILALAAVPRWMMACRIDVVCPDGMLYIQLAGHVEQGEVPPDNCPYGFNVYTLVLATLHRGGLDWEFAAKVWGVICGTLVVLPTFGWLRRQFNLPIAVVGCMLYAVHPKLIEWSGEVVRESTFWLLFAATLYFGWRAAAEVRARFYVAAGVFLTLSIHTRFEGWFLLVPLLIWTWGRFTRPGIAKPERRQLTWGVVSLAGSYPLVLLALIQLHGYKEWPDSFHRLRFVHDWLSSLVASEESPSVALPATGSPAPGTLQVAESSPAAVAEVVKSADVAEVVVLPAEPSPRMSTPEMTWIFFRTLIRGLSPVYAVFLGCGLLAFPRLLRRVDVLALLLGSSLTLGGMWIHLWFGQASSSRYPLSVAIAFLPLASLGLLELSYRLATWNAWFLGHPRPTPRLGVAIALAIAAIAGGVDAFITSYDGRLAKADLGRYIRNELGENCRILGSQHWSLTAYYAQGQYLQLPESPQNQPADLTQFVADCDADVVLLTYGQLPRRRAGEVLEMQQRLGLSPLADESLPATCRGQVLVLRRKQATARLHSAAATPTQH